MATIYRIHSDWTLTDGIIDPIRLDRPRTIYDALRRENMLPDAHLGMNSAACEWIYNRTFVYEKRFDQLPTNDTERTELYFEHMYGECEVTVNGQRFEAFARNRYDITAAVQPADNLLRVCVRPRPFTGGVIRPAGICGTVALTGANRITVLNSGVFCSDVLGINLLIDAHISGKFRFTCLLSREGEGILNQEVHQRLIAARQAIQLNFPLPENAEGMYDLQLTIEHNGLMCDILRRSVCIVRRHEPEAVCHIQCEADAEEAVIAALPHLKSAGFDALSLPLDEMFTSRIHTRMQELSLLRAPYCPKDMFTGCMDAETLRKYAAAMRCWPDDAPVWRLRGDKLARIDRFGDIPAGDMQRTLAAVRLTQAQQVFDAIIAARKAKEEIDLTIGIPAFPYFTSASLWDAGIPRPALYAAKQALQPLIAVADISEDVLPTGEVLKLPILLLNRKGVKPLPVTVTAAMYDIDGRIISGTSFSALPGGEMKLGELNCELPASARCAVLRTAVEQPGEKTVYAERFILCGDKPLYPAELPHAAEDGFRFGIVTEGGIRILLPGEPAEGAAGEYFNQ